MKIKNRVNEKLNTNKTKIAEVQELINEENVKKENHLKILTHTDRPFLIIHGIFLILLVLILCYTITNGNIDRVTKGYDLCGNVCGTNNKFDIKHQSYCKAKDMTDKPLLYINGDYRVCVENYSNSHYGFRSISEGEEEINELRLDEFLKGFSENLYESSNEILTLLGIVSGLSFVMLLMVRYLTAVFVWSTVFGIILAYTSGAAYFGTIAITADSISEQENSILLTIICTIIPIIMIGIIFLIRKRLQLFIQVLKETGKFIMKMPFILFLPILTYIILLITWGSWFYFLFWIESSGTPYELFGTVTFVKTGFMYFAEFYSIFMMMWMVQFVCGLQNMLIAGAISTCYFTRNKRKLDRPIYKNVQNIIKYHLGTISITSLILGIMEIVKFIVLSLGKILRFSKSITHCLNYVRDWIRYYTKNSYIITAMHGYSFYEAGSRSFKLIMGNITQIITINNVGEHVLVIAKILVAGSTVGVARLMIKHKLEIEYEWPVLSLIGILAYMIVHCFLSVYEVAVDTIFVCFCEDREVNDGISLPYFMSSELMEFMENSKTIVEGKDLSKNIVTT